ncbi:heme-degrading domain-containing protein [Sodalis sp. dw_96]|uniref:heme-degrading domain-containing protein n=1 Tax=Sodalis sp. dw_96 TaxID=2719794 RepID=UPI001BD43E67|nr:heme-degrading domain-containing protein [Sodalis sp. dw_96]
MNAKITLEELLRQEAEIHFDSFDMDSAWEIGQGIRRHALENNSPVSIEVYAFGQELFLAALPGSSQHNLSWMRRKRNTVLHEAHSSMYVGLENEKNGQRMDQQRYTDQSRFTDHGGSFPLLLAHGGIIGAVSVSGLPSHEDHALVVWGLRQYLAR